MQAKDDASSTRKRAISSTDESLVPPVKRVKQEGGELAPRRSEQFWIRDRHVVVQIQEIQFRVNSGVLASHSPFFRELFDSGLAEALDLVEGCQVYRVNRLADASAFRTLLTVLYEGVTAFATSKPFVFDTMSCILRASTALDFPEVRSWAIEELERRYPLGLDEFDADDNDYAMERLKELGSWDYMDYSTAGESDGEEAQKPDTASVATADQPGKAITVSPGALQANRLKGEGTNDDAEETELVTTSDSIEKDEANKLSHTDIQLGIRLRERISRRWLVFASPPEDVCTEPAGKNTSPSCHEVFAREWPTRVTRASLFEEGFYHPLDSLNSLKGIDWVLLGVCKKCAEAQKKKWEKERKTIWKKMDKWLCLDEEPIPSSNA